MKNLIVYFSKTGTTMKVVDEVSKKLNSDVAKLSSKSGFFGTLFKSIFGGKMELDPIKFNPEKYDLVIIATPVWGGNPIAHIKTFCQRYKFNKVAFIITRKGSGLNRPLKKLTSLTKEPVAVLEFVDETINGNPRKEKIDKFVNEINSLK